MKVLAINATYRRNQSTTRLANAALQGAATVGAETEMIMLRDHKIEYCTNCLSCYGNLEPELPPCKITDDMDGILQKLWDADGVIFASPVHNGFVTGLMTAFFERATWRMCRPTGGLLSLKGFPQARSSKVRALATIVSAGGVPHGLPKMIKRLDDLGSVWMRSCGSTALNGRSVGELFAGACFPEKLKGDDWSKAYFLRRLADEQLEEARELGKKLAQVLQEGKALPHDYLYDIASLLGPFGDMAANVVTTLQRFRYRR